MTPAKRESRPLGPVTAGVLGRVNEARAAYLHATGRDLLWAEVGRAMGWTQSTTSAIKTGRRAIALDEIPRIAEVLGVREAWLAVGEGPVRPDGDAAAAATPSAAAPPPRGPVGRLEDELTEIPPPSPPGIRRRA